MDGDQVRNVRRPDLRWRVRRLLWRLGSLLSAWILGLAGLLLLLLLRWRVRGLLLRRVWDVSGVGFLECGDLYGEGVQHSLCRCKGPQRGLDRCR